MRDIISLIKDYITIFVFIFGALSLYVSYKIQKSNEPIINRIVYLEANYQIWVKQMALYNNSAK